MADPDYLRSLVAMMRAIADDCFDRNAAVQMRALADKIDHDISSGFIVTLNSNYSSKKEA